MASNIQIGQYIQRLRKEKGLSQKQLAEKLNISFQAVSKWETGESLPDISILLELSNVLDTTTDKILSGGYLVIRQTQFIQVDHIIEGFKALENLRYYFGEKSTFYLGAIEGINQKMNIDFEQYIKNDRYKETMLAEVIIQHLMNGYHIEKSDIDSNIKSDKLRNIIYKYTGDEVTMNRLRYPDHKELFEQIRHIKPEFQNVDTLSELPGEYIRMEPNKYYWCTQIEVSADLCYGIAVDESKIYVFSYGEGGIDNKLIHEELRK
ncbi:MAG: helix-turn-helix domain-containing protein [Acholeplasmataceae bacterium]|nr:helix-turn-helix domain-containing protein [Acholeplasmataceae bacterium]